MATELNLIETDFQDIEKRILPRFPLTFLLFKRENDGHASEVKDISLTGMQVEVSNSANFKKGDSVEGTVHWRGPSLTIQGTIQWVNADRIGIEFNQEDGFESRIKDFLSFDNIIAGMRKVHETHIELPAQLKYWLRSEGPVELFVWRHPHGELSKIQFIFFHHFVEWVDGEGISSGKLLTQRDSDLPLSLEGEFMFEIDRSLDVNKIQFCRELMKTLPESYLPEAVVSFILLKLGE
jgi:hypothetical protein